MNNLLSAEEVKRFLEIEEPDLKGLVDLGKLHAYRIGGTYLRFRKEEVLNVKQEFQAGKKSGPLIPWFVRVRDFWRFNNFYILSLLFIVLLFLVVVRS